MELRPRKLCPFRTDNSVHLETYRTGLSGLHDKMLNLARGEIRATLKTGEYRLTGLPDG